MCETAMERECADCVQLRRQLVMTQREYAAACALINVCLEEFPTHVESWPEWDELCRIQQAASGDEEE